MDDETQRLLAIIRAHMVMCKRVIELEVLQKVLTDFEGGIDPREEVQVKQNVRT